MSSDSFCLSNYWLNKNKREHNFFYVSLLLCTIFMHVLVVGLYILSEDAGTNNNNHLFVQSTTNTSNQLYVDILPAEWTFTLFWTTSFVLQSLWLLYAFVNLFRRVKNGDGNGGGELVYRKTNLFFYGIILSYLANLIFLLVWLFIWTQIKLLEGLIFMTLATLAIQTAFFVSLRMLQKEEENLLSIGLRADIWLTRILTQNGLALFATWSAYYCCLILSAFLTHLIGVEGFRSGSIAIAFLFLLIVAYFVLENFVWQRFLLHVFTPWLVLLIALPSSLASNLIKKDKRIKLNPSKFDFNHIKVDELTRNNIFLVILIALASLMTITKLVMFILYKTKLRNRVNHLCKSGKIESC